MQQLSKSNIWEDFFPCMCLHNKNSSRINRSNESWTKHEYEMRIMKVVYSIPHIFSYEVKFIVPFMCTTPAMHCSDGNVCLLQKSPRHCWDLLVMTCECMQRAHILVYSNEKMHVVMSSKKKTIVWCSLCDCSHSLCSLSFGTFARICFAVIMQMHIHELFVVY